MVSGVVEWGLSADISVTGASAVYLDAILAFFLNQIVSLVSRYSARWVSPPTASDHHVLWHFSFSYTFANYGVSLFI